MIPALRQSHCELLACEVLYATVVIAGQATPPSLANYRGQEIHDVMAKYIRGCAEQRRPSWWPFFDQLARARGPEARQILRGLRNHYVVDFDHHLGAEQKLRLDHNFQPCGERGDTAAFEGTLDHLLGYVTQGKIEDFKSHPAPFEAKTPQAHLYPLLVLQHYPEFEQVTFELVFVRYRNCRRAVSWRRSDIPELIDYMQAFRERQVDLHARADDAEATPGAHCQYCPKLADVTCPVAEFNPHATHSPEERLRFNIWASQLKAQNNEVLRSYVNASDENVTITDGKGQRYEYGCWDHASTVYPLAKVYHELLEWKRERGEDLVPRMRVGATELKQMLKAKKRADLAERIGRHLVPVNTPRWGVKKPDGNVEGDDDV
jgi:PD-(D/E)XK nuclease superfamily